MAKKRHGPTEEEIDVAIIKQLHQKGLSIETIAVMTKPAEEIRKIIERKGRRG